MTDNHADREQPDPADPRTPRDAGPDTPQPHAPDTPRKRSSLAGWAQLVRLPNLLTAPGDPLVGFLAAGMVTIDSPIAWSTRVAMVAGASVLLYAFGLVVNDVFDLSTDRRERPDRPLPSGAVSVLAAIMLAGALLAGGLGLAYRSGGAVGWVALALVGAIFFYNALAKRVPILGPVAMGACRGANVLMGAALAGTEGLRLPGPIFVASLVAVYIAAVTHVATGEVTGRRVGTKRNFPAGVLAFGYTFLLVPALGEGGEIPVRIWLSLAGAVVAVVWAAWCAMPLAGRPEPKDVQKGVGGMVGGLLLAEAPLAAMVGGMGIYVAAGMIVAFVGHRLASRFFYAS